MNSERSDPGPYAIVIGLEVHVQLKTASKLFCGCSTQFGAEPNTQTCPVCLGLPGSLPVMNRRAFELALRTAVALQCQIPEYTKWDRKNYFYPDLPKGYQISQFDLPMSHSGWLEIADPKGEFPVRSIRIRRAHLEEDAGKSLHDEASGKADSRIDLNRTGTPLLEIVSEPDLRSPREARAYLNELKLLLEYLEVSDCNMQEGSLRVDANINLHLADAAGGMVATPIVEVKNMNSFRAVERALAYEAERQFAAWRETGRTIAEVPKSTRGWDDQRQATFAQRQKEESSDYRYFPDPDLVPVTVSVSAVDAVRAALGELPAATRQRLESAYRLNAYDADVIVNQGRQFIAYFEQVAQRCGDGKLASNWVTQEVLRILNSAGGTIDRFPISADGLGELIEGVRGGQVPSSRSKELFGAMFSEGLSLAAALRKLGIQALDAGALEQLCRQLLTENPRIVADVKSGKAQAAGALVGLAKKKNANVNPAEVREICARLIAEMP
ncbi:MAG: Asp-tRNA(Asn)/Glu-tRNA(Gln) amidotransferase subunit GatB [Planctomycetes bacterium]|nr:Asp-tRNA(Asn)/Glu-tRNA(Gln) amidotransferase subunit GatB [Planctomycetota bacterium]